MAKPSPLGGGGPFGLRAHGLLRFADHAEKLVFFQQENTRPMLLDYL